MTKRRGAKPIHHAVRPRNGTGADKTGAHGGSIGRTRGPRAPGYIFRSPAAHHPVPSHTCGYGYSGQVGVSEEKVLACVYKPLPVRAACSSLGRRLPRPWGARRAATRRASSGGPGRRRRTSSCGATSAATASAATGSPCRRKQVHFPGPDSLLCTERAAPRARSSCLVLAATLAPGPGASEDFEQIF